MKSKVIKIKLNPMKKKKKKKIFKKMSREIYGEKKMADKENNKIYFHKE